MFFTQEFSDATPIAVAAAAPTIWGAARVAGRLDAEMTAYLSVHVLPEFDAAKSWSDLMTRLRAKGFTLRGRNGRMVLKDRSAGTDICHTRDLGVTTQELQTRFA